MNLVEEYIKPRLMTFTETPDKGFYEVYDYLQLSQKDELTKFFIYADKLINQLINKTDKNLAYSHIHFEGLDARMIHLIIQFISVKFFVLSLISDKNDCNVLSEEIAKINCILKKPIELPYGEKDGGKKTLKLFKEERRNFGQKKIFFEEIEKINLFASIRPKVLLNLMHNEYNILKEQFNNKQFVIPIENITIDKSYVVANWDKSRDEIDKIKLTNGHYFLDQIESIILFNCEKRQMYRMFNFRELNDWNGSSGNFHNLIIFSFNEGGFRFNKLKSRLDRIQSRFHSTPKYPNYNSYVVLPYELRILLNQTIDENTIIEFWGESYSSFWEDFNINIGNFEGLYELRSLKMKSIYSLIINESLRDILLEDIFSFDDDPKIITIETREVIEELAQENIDELKNNLSNTLDWIIQSGWKDYLRKQINNTTAIVLPEKVISNVSFIKEFYDSLKLSNKNEVTSWFDIDVSTEREVLILDYRDLGPFPYNINPNIFENMFVNSPLIMCLFLSFLFENKFKWTRFNYQKDLINIFDNPVRNNHFQWYELYKENQKLRPQNEDNIKWEIENEYQGNRELNSIKIKYEWPKKSRSYHASELFIVRQDNEKALKIRRLDDLSDEDLNETTLEVQMIDEIYQEFNLYDKLTNKDREEKELAIIRSKFNLDKSESAGRLWKILLKKKSEELGINTLYEKLKSIINKKDLKIVSYNTFLNIWLNPDSKSIIPREKKVFFNLCEYLELPLSYFRIMLRLKNVEIQSSRNSNKQMNSLLSDLVNDGCFNESGSVIEILSKNIGKYIEKHDFDEIGIGQENMVNELKALVELLKPYLKLTKVEKIEDF